MGTMEASMKQKHWKYEGPDVESSMVEDSSKMSGGRPEGGRNTGAGPARGGKAQEAEERQPGVGRRQPSQGARTPGADVAPPRGGRRKPSYNIVPIAGLVAFIALTVIFAWMLVNKPAEQSLQPADWIQGESDGGAPGQAETAGGQQDGEGAYADPAEGEWNGGVYTNEFAEITYTLSDGWERKNDEALDFSGTAAAGRVNAALIVNKDSGDNVFIRIFDLGATLDGGSVYETEFLEGMREAGEKDAAAAAVFGEIFSVNVGGKAYLAMQERAANIATLYYLARRVGDYMVIITVKTEGDLEEALVNFS
jgi:hypothetical protein